MKITLNMSENSRSCGYKFKTQTSTVSSVSSAHSFSEQEIFSFGSNGTSTSASSKSVPITTDQILEYTLSDETAETEKVYETSDYVDSEEGWFSTKFDVGHLGDVIDDSITGKIIIYPPIMENFKNFKEILSETFQESGAFVYISRSLMVAMHIPYKKPILDDLLCDIIIFCRDKPVTILTVTTSEHAHKLDNYNSRIAQEFIVPGRKEFVDFKVINGVVLEGVLHSSGALKDSLQNIKTMASVTASAKSFAMNATRCKAMILTLIKITAITRSGDLWHEHWAKDGDVYMKTNIYKMFTNIIEERRHVTVKSANKDALKTLLSELCTRLSITGNVGVFTYQENISHLAHLRRIPSLTLSAFDDTSRFYQTRPKGSVCVSSKWSKDFMWMFRVKIRNEWELQERASYSDVVKGSTSGTAALKVKQDSLSAESVNDSRVLIANTIVKNMMAQWKNVTDDQRNQIADIFVFNIKQTVERTFSFISDLLKAGTSMDKIKRDNSFLEDYLMTSFRQCSLKLMPQEASPDTNPERRTWKHHRGSTCSFCKRRHNSEVLQERLQEMKEIIERFAGDLSVSSFPHAVEWSKLTGEARSMEDIVSDTDTSSTTCSCETCHTANQ